MKTQDEAPVSERETESINGQLFAGFSSDDEKQWLVGGSNTANIKITYRETTGTDVDSQWDWNW